LAKISRRSLIAAPLALSPLACPAYAQAPWPSRPIRIIIPFGTGGGTDITTRLLAPKMAEILGQPVVLENRPGAGGVVGTDYVAKQPANGDVFVLSTLSPHAVVLGEGAAAATATDCLATFTPTLRKPSRFLIACEGAP
jgi:tripartite-type tricarboxylate transporter receptor subunit TctC